MKFPLALAPGKGFHSVSVIAEALGSACLRRAGDSHSAIANLSVIFTIRVTIGIEEKFVAAECGDQVAAATAQRAHFKIESTGYITPFLMTVSISEAFLMSSNGFELRITRSAKQPFSSLPMCAPVSPPKSFAAFAVVH